MIRGILVLSVRNVFSNKASAFTVEFHALELSLNKSDISVEFVVIRGLHLLICYKTK